MGYMVRFLKMYCPYCKTELPVQIHYKNMGYLWTCCDRCKKGVYIYKQQAIDRRKR